MEMVRFYIKLQYLTFITVIIFEIFNYVDKK